MKFCFFSSSNFTNEEYIQRFLDMNRDKMSGLVSGGAGGADEYARKWLEKNGGKCIIHYPIKYDQDGNYNKGSMFSRNSKMISEADKIIIFWDGESQGTKYAIDFCREKRANFSVVYFDSSNGRILNVT